MSNLIQGSCPVCKLEEQELSIRDCGECISLECPRCGKFTITRTAAAMLEKKGPNHKLSAWIRQQQDSSRDTPEINSVTLKRIESTLPDYTVVEKQLLLLKVFGRKAQYNGKTFDVITHFDYPLAWAVDEEEFLYILRLLIERKLVRRTDGPPDLEEDSFRFEFEITAEGWAQLERDPLLIKPNKEKKEYDLFISYASEDKDTIARPLYKALTKKGVTVWFDEVVLSLGDSLNRKINEGLTHCRFGIVILSLHFFSKNWPQRELDGLVALETASGEKRILPIWHELDRDTVLRYSPTLADRYAGRSEEGVPVLVKKILEGIGR